MWDGVCEAGRRGNLRGYLRLGYLRLGFWFWAGFFAFFGGFVAVLLGFGFSFPWCYDGGFLL